MRIEKISPINIPLSHYRWAGIDIEDKEEKKNDLDTDRINKIITLSYHKKIGIYNKKGEFIPFLDSI